MPIESKVDPATGIVSLLQEGEVSVKEQVTVLSGLLRRKELRPPFRVLIDRRAITEIWGRDQVQVAADTLAGFGPIVDGARVAVVVQREVAYGMVRMLQAYTDGLPVKLRGFYEEAEAIEWLRDGAE